MWTSLRGRESKPLQQFVEHLEPRRLFAIVGIGAGANTVLTADLNNDGRIDVATSNDTATTDSISILFGEGHGSFAPAATLTLGTGCDPKDMAAADFNGDGKTDLAIAGGSHTYVLLQTSDGTFAAPVAVSAATLAPQAVTAADFNRDGKIDLATPEGGTNLVDIWLNNGNATFTAAASVTTKNSPVDILSADFNADNKPDLAVAMAVDGFISVALGNGNGTFATTVNVPVPQYTGLITAGDYNGDGKLDLVAALTSTNGFVSVPGNGNGTFAAYSQKYGLPPITGMATADLNADGYDDILAAIPKTSAGHQVAVIPGSASGPDEYGGSPLSFTSGPDRVAVGDFNGDGKTDLAALSIAAANISLFLGNGNKTFTATPDSTFAAPISFAVATNAGPEAVISADFNGDGKPDLATANTGSNTLSVLLGGNNGTFGALNNSTVGASPSGLVAGDFNGDGKADLAAANANSNTVSILLGNGNGTFAAATNINVGADPVKVVTGDFNRDGKMDLAVANYLGNSISILLGNGSGGFSAIAPVPQVSSPDGIAAADFNADGRIDLAVADDVPNTVSILLGTGSGSFTSFGTFAVGAEPYDIITADLNNDGKPDLATADDSGRSVSILIGGSNGTFAAAITVPVLGNPSSITAGDLDGDGDIDLATANFSNNSVSVVLNNGNGTFVGAPPLADPNGPYAVLFGEFDGDGRPDLVAANFSNSTVSVFLNSMPDGLSVLESGGVVTITGTATVSENAGTLSVVTASGTRRLAASSIVGLSLSNGANVTISSDLGIAGGSGHVSLTVNSGATAAINAAQHLTSLTVNGTAMMAAGGGRVLRAMAITLGTTGIFDLKDNALIYDYSGSGPQFPRLLYYLNTGRANGAWNGYGIISSAARSNTLHNTTLGYLEATDYKSVYGSTATFNSEAVDNTAVLVKYTYYGDTDFNGKVDANDYARIDSGFQNQHNAGFVTDWFSGDFNYDGKVDANDYALIDGAFQTQGSPLSSPESIVASIGGPSLNPAGGAGKLRRV